MSKSSRTLRERGIKMQRKKIVAAVQIILSLASVSIATIAFGQPVPIPGSTLAPQILAVNCGIVETNPPVLRVEAAARAFVPTTGNSLLVRVGQAPDENGIMHYNFLVFRGYDPIAESSQGASNIALPICVASNQWQGFPKGIRGVTVHGLGDGAKTVLFEEDDEGKLRLPKVGTLGFAEIARLNGNGTLPRPLANLLSEPISSDSEPSDNGNGTWPLGNGTWPMGNGGWPWLADSKTQEHSGVPFLLEPDIERESTTQEHDGVPFGAGTLPWSRGMQPVATDGTGEKAALVDFHLRSVYLPTRMYGYGRFSIFGQIDDRGRGTARLNCDPNQCGVNEFGDTEWCTKRGDVSFEVTLAGLRLADPRHENRWIFAVDGAGIPATIYLVLHPSRPYGHRLVFEEGNERPTRSAVTLEGVAVIGP